MARLGWVGCGAVNCGWVDYGEARGGGALCKGGGGHLGHLYNTA